MQWELKQQGLLFSNINIPAIEDDQVSFLVILMIMIIDAVLYFVVTWYIEGVYPGQYGVAKPWYFPFTSSYWCGKKPSGALWNRCSRKAVVTLQEDEQELEGEFCFVSGPCEWVLWVWLSVHLVSNGRSLGLIGL